MRRKRWWVFCILFLVVGCSEGLNDRKVHLAHVPKAPAGATYVGSETCLECHEDFSQDQRHNVHMRLAAYEVSGEACGCEACHGPGSLHVEEEDPDKIFRFSLREGLSAEGASAICLQCHRDGETMHWLSSVHAEEEVSCLECHRVHQNPRASLLREPEFRMCSSCHRDIQAKMYFISRHPVKEGKMRCSDCHNPHGSGNPVEGMLRTDERLNDLCLRCHTRYQGPFVFEHDPVIEDCTICHDPHGSIANNLLKQNEPFVCLQCHEAHFHATRTNAAPGTVFPTDTQATDSIYGTDPVYFTDPYTGKTPEIVSRQHGWQRSFLTKCTQCHQQVHGSDLPSQSLPSRGQGLTR